ncbi:MAG: patatin-like phospholipase family protein [Solirubrobacteraceae bacterium]
MREEPIALVLAGGGARGACEAGLLSVLLPVLEERNERPTILIGTSAGAVNVSFLGSGRYPPCRATQRSIRNRATDTFGGNSNVGLRR